MTAVSNRVAGFHRAEELLPREFYLNHSYLLKARQLENLVQIRLYMYIRDRLVLCEDRATNNVH